MGGPQNALTWPRDRRASGPGGRGDFPPGARATGWSGRPGQPRLLQAGSQARTPTHTRLGRARARTPTLPHSHSPTLARTRSHKARLPPDSAILTRRLAAEATRRPQAPRPGGTVPPHPAAPTPLPAPAAALELASCCVVTPRSPRPAASRSRLRPPLRGGPERGRPLRPPRWGRAPRQEAGGGSAAAILAGQDPGSALQGDTGVTALGASAAARVLRLRLWRAGRDGRRRAAEGRQQRGRQPSPSSACFLFLLTPSSTSQQLPHPQTPSPDLIPLPGVTPPEPRPSALPLPHSFAELPAAAA